MVDLDGYELALRKLPGVVAVGMELTEEVIVIRLSVADAGDSTELRRRAVELGQAHVSRPVTVAIDELGPRPTGRRPGRVRLLAVRDHTVDGEVEVHLAHGESRTVGRAAAADVASAVDATLDALVGLGARVPFRVRQAAEVGGSGITAVVVVLDGDGSERMGVAQAGTAAEAASRATLHALNRYLAQPDVLLPAAVA